MATLTKLKGEIKRLRQELIKGPSKRGIKYDDSEAESDDSWFDEEERAAIKML